MSWKQKRFLIPLYNDFILAVDSTNGFPHFAPIAKKVKLTREELVITLKQMIGIQRSNAERESNLLSTLETADYLSGILGSSTERATRANQGGNAIVVTTEPNH